MNMTDKLQRALQTGFKDEAEYLKERRREAIQWLGNKWLLHPTSKTKWRLG